MIPRWGRGGDIPPLPEMMAAAEAATVESVCAWLQWVDPNGSHTAELADADGFDPYTHAEAVEAMREILETD